MLGQRLSQKMFEYLRDTHKLIPRPIRVSKGKGVVGYYPEFAILLMRKVMKKRETTGASFKDIKGELKAEIDSVMSQADYYRTQFYVEKDAFKQYLSDVLAAYNHPAPAREIKKIVENGKVVKSTYQDKLDTIKNKIKSECDNWNGKSESGIKRIRIAIDEYDKVNAEYRAASKHLDIIRNKEVFGGQSGQKPRVVARKRKNLRKR